jgi:hypothetical protein
MRKGILLLLLVLSLGAQGQALWLESGYKQAFSKSTDVSVDVAWRGRPSEQGRAFVDVELDQTFGKRFFGFYECRVNLWGTQARNTYGLGVEETLKWKGAKLFQLDYAWRYHDDDQEFRQSFGVERKFDRWKPKLEVESWYRPWETGGIRRKLRASAGLQYNPKGPGKWEAGVLRQNDYSKKGNFQSSEWAVYLEFQWRLPG